MKNLTSPGLLLDMAAFHALFDTVAAVGCTPLGGLNRVAASQEDGQSRDLVCAWLAQRHFKISVDRVGNIYALLTLADPTAPYVLTGSHLDSQPRGGRFDGAYGVIGACIVADAMRTCAQQQFSHNLGVVIWTNEEGARFSPSMLGSGVFAGRYTSDFALSRQDVHGVTLAQALGQIGYLGDSEAPAVPAAYVELHIEQGGLLEISNAGIGVVEGNWGAVKYAVTLRGTAAHTGPTPMEQRRDALLAAAKLVVACRAISDATFGKLLTSVGRMDIEPNSSNVIAGSVTVYADLRTTDNALLIESSLEFERAASTIAADAKIEVDLQQVVNRSAGIFDAGLCTLVEQVATAKGYRPMRLSTIAGHDAIALCPLCPTAMIFVPSKDGISHNEAEFTSSTDLEAGLDVLGGTLHELLRKPLTP